MSMTIGHLPFGTSGFDKNKNDVKQKNGNAGFLQQVRNDFTEIDKTAEEGASKARGYMGNINDINGKTSDISGKNEEKLSRKAQDFFNGLRDEYGEFDFLIGNRTDDLQALSKTGCKEFSVIFSSAEIERMANDEKYANEKMQGVFGAVRMAYQIEEEYGTGTDAGQNGMDNVEKLGVIVDDNGTMKFFADLEKNSAKQKERIEKAREERAGGRREAERERRKNPYEKKEEPSVKRTRVEADTMEELLEKIGKVDWESIAESKSGDRFSQSV